MNIKVHRYVLRSRGVLNSLSEKTEHEGALLNVDGGFACLHPWPELGDPCLNELLEDLTTEKTRLVQRAMICAMLDREARLDKRSLFDGLTIPASHATISCLDDDWVHQAVQLGFKVIKMKGGRDLVDEKNFLLRMHNQYPDLRWRLDFNHSCSFDQSRIWYQGLEPSLKHAIDFIEDAFFQDEEPDEPWLAIDREIERWKKPVNTAIIKPAINAASVFLNRRSFAEHYVFTSYMDHPIGQMYAAYEAARASESLGSRLAICGLVTQHLWEGNSFTQQLGDWSPCLTVPAGYGLGFDEQLNELEWTQV